jgi:hypothetical protein
MLTCNGRVSRAGGRVRLHASARRRAPLRQTIGEEAGTPGCHPLLSYVIVEFNVGCHGPTDKRA